VPALFLLKPQMKPTVCTYGLGRQFAIPSSMATTSPPRLMMVSERPMIVAELLAVKLLAGVLYWSHLSEVRICPKQMLSVWFFELLMDV